MRSAVAGLTATQRIFNDNGDHDDAPGLERGDVPQPRQQPLPIGSESGKALETYSHYYMLMGRTEEEMAQALRSHGNTELAGVRACFGQLPRACPTRGRTRCCS